MELSIGCEIGIIFCFITGAGAGAGALRSNEETAAVPQYVEAKEERILGETGGSSLISNEEIEPNSNSDGVLGEEGRESLTLC